MGVSPPVECGQYRAAKVLSATTPGTNFAYADATELEGVWSGRLTPLPGTSGGAATLVAAGGYNQSWLVALENGYGLAAYLRSTLAGGFPIASINNANSQIQLYPLSGKVLSVKMMWRADNGSGVPDVRQWISSDGGATWVVNSAASGSALPTVVYPPVSHKFIVGSGSGNGVAGETAYAHIKRNGVVVASFDARQANGGSWTDPQGNVWTITTSGWTVLP